MRIFIVIALMLFPLCANANKKLPAECRYLPEHMPRDDVAYKAGVDVKGRSVVSANLTPTPFDLPDVLTVPLSVDTVERARDAGVPLQGLEGLGNLGVIEIHKNGRVTWNGQDWSNSFYALCGHDAPDDVISDAIHKKETKKQPDVATKRVSDKTSKSMDDERVIYGGDYR